MDNDARIDLRLPASLLDDLKEMAEQEDRSVGAILRLAARQYLDRAKET